MAPVPSMQDLCWAKALTGPQPQVSSLATRLLLSRLREDVRRDPALLDGCAAQLQGFFQANAFALRDLAVLRGERACATNS